MADRRLSRWLVAALLAPLACGPGPYDDHLGDSRFLDRACEGGACMMKGGAQRVSGPTADASAFLLDSTGHDATSAEVTIPMTKVVIPPSDDICHVELLVSGKGAFAVGSQSPESFDAPEALEWVRVHSDCRAPVVVSVQSGATLLIDDVRIVTTQTPPAGCLSGDL